MDEKDERKRSIDEVPITTYEVSKSRVRRARETKFNGYLAFWLNGIRDKGGMSLIRALLRNRRSYCTDDKGEWRKPLGESQRVPMLYSSGGSVCSSDEASVMEVEPRD